MYILDMCFHIDSNIVCIRIFGILFVLGIVPLYPFRALFDFGGVLFVHVAHSKFCVVMIHSLVSKPVFDGQLMVRLLDCLVIYRCTSQYILTSIIKTNMCILQYT